MTSNITIMNSAEFGEVRTVLREGEPWFVAKDVCDVLGLGNNRQALARLDDDELASLVMTSGGQGREMNIVSESGLYSLILTSRKPEAKAFKRWITHDVLPSIRKQGYYSMIKDEDLVAILTERRKENATYLLEELADSYEKVNAERYEQLKVIWNNLRFDLDLKEVDKLIDEIWCGDGAGAAEAKKHYRDLYFSKLGMSHIYGKWKDPKKPKVRKFARERETIRYYEKVALEEKLNEILNNGGCRIEDCKNSIELLERRDRAVLKQYYEIQSLKAENERLKNMVNAAVN